MSVPKSLVDLVEAVSHPAVTQTGVTRTDDGRWALLAQVRKGTTTPLRELEDAAGDFPIVYEEEPDVLPTARPAFPAEDE